jgi:small subunit ribosomal protein S17
MAEKTKKTKEVSEKNGKLLSGKVVSTKMQKTVIVEVNRFIKHPKYEKFFTVTKRFKAHDEHMKSKLGETVTIRETRPLSKDKNFEVVFEK